MILGTAAYMAPEQARGQNVHRRADIWAFGVVLYEMVTGRQLFGGPTVSDTLAAVLKGELDLSPAPPEVRPVLERCLRRDARLRWRSIGDVLVTLEEGAKPVPAAGPERPSAVGWIAVTVLGVALLIVSGFLWRATRPVDHPLTRLSVDLGPEAMVGLNTTAAISPDGRRLVFPTRAPDGKQLLATRLLDQAHATLLPGTQGGTDPFFSPDGQWVGFFAGGTFKKISVQGGAPVTLVSVNFPRGASWDEHGNIVATLGNTQPLARFPAAGGKPQVVTNLGPGEASHRWPQVLPGGSAVLFTASGSASGQDNANIAVVTLKSGQAKVVQRGGYFGRYLPSGHMVYVHQGVLFGVGFDLARLEVRGTPVPLVDDLAVSPTTGGGQFDFSASGTLVYLAGKSSAQSWQVSWMDNSGKMQPLIAAPGTYVRQRFSPDGRKLAFESAGDIFVQDLERGTATKLTFTGRALLPVWAPDGRHIAFNDGHGIFWIRSDGAGEVLRLLEGQYNVVPQSFSPDGRHLAYYEVNPETRNDLWTLPLDVTDPDHPKPGKAEPFLRTPAAESVPRFSPDGRWIAHTSDETGTFEVYVRPFPGGGGGKWQVSTGGGKYPSWSSNRHELFYESMDDRIMAVDYTVDGASFVPGKTRVWYEKPIFDPGTVNLDLAPDGKRFAVLTAPEDTRGDKGTVHVTMLLDFFDEARRRIPAGK
jgi:serine/threonine-protein kinase